MPKNLKNSPIQQSATVPDPTDAVPAGPVARPSKKSLAAKKSASSKKTVSKKKTAPDRAKSKSAKPPKKTTAKEPRDSEISLRAYFIAEERTRLSLPGDPANDWLEAKRQLVTESQRAG